MSGSSPTAVQVQGALPAAARRWGVKGPGALAWLHSRGITIPGAPNRVIHWHGGRCLRLGNSEFLIEQDEITAAPLVPDDAPADANAWVLLRSDCCVVLSGHPWPAAMAQGCSFDFERLRADPDLVVMTLFAGISVTLVREPAGADAPLSLRLWCDASHSLFLHQCLQQIALPRPPGDRE
jgi:sarcosine oxidase, subunit gamma